MLKVKISDIFDFEKGSLQSSKNTAGDYDFITASSEWKTHNEYTHECEAIIVAVAASGSLGRTHYVNGKFISSDLCYILQPKDGFQKKIDLKFYHLYFNFIREDLVYKTATGSAKKAINQQNFANYKIVFPDISYQEKVVKKLNIINPNFADFSTLNRNNESYIQKLRNAILQEAVEGKLVPQDKNDEPASEILKRIKTEKEKLIKEGKIKKEKPLPPISQTEIPFSIPQSWQYCRWIDLLSYDKYSMKRGPFGSSLKKGYFVDKGIRVFEQYNPINDDPYWVRYYITPEKYEELSAFTAKAGDLLISCSGVTLGRITEIPDDTDWGIINQALLKLTLHKQIISNSYFKMLFRSPYMQKQIFDMALGSAIPNMVGVTELKKILIPLPPLKEQKRIVEKVDELMALCDELETQINESKQTGEQLMQAVLQEVFNKN